MNDLVSIISSLGFPIVACVALGYFCKYMIDTNNANIGKMFDMYERSNEENREAINSVKEVIDRLSEKLDKLV